MLVLRGDGNRKGLIFSVIGGDNAAESEISRVSSQMRRGNLLGGMSPRDFMSFDFAPKGSAHSVASIRSVQIGQKSALGMSAARLQGDRQLLGNPTVQ